MDFILCSAAFVICLVLPVSSQPPPKRIGEWHPDRYMMYPNPRVNVTDCNTMKPSGLCDYNEMLTKEQRSSFSEQKELQVSAADECLCNQSCGTGIRIIFTVAVMKKIGPDITDYRAAAKEFAEKFRASWGLPDCSVILIVSCLDNLGYLEEGTGVSKVLNETEEWRQKIYECFTNRSCAECINETLNIYRNALAVAAAQTPAPTPESEAHQDSSTVIVIVIVVIVCVLGVCVVIIIVFRVKRRARKPQGKEEERLNRTPEAKAV